MQTEEQYEDLTALFEAQDEALQSDAFVDRVMKPIHARSRWRGSLLFGAGGIGVGAAVSQMGGLFEAVQARTASFSLSIGEFQTPTWEIVAADPFWIGGIVMVVMSCVAIIATERA